MGLIGGAFRALFGGGRNVVAETAGIWRENSEAGAQRRADYAQAALAQYAGEFAVARKGGFDRFMDGLNRLPRPLIMLSTLALFGSAMHSPIWFAERMQGLAAVPDPLWWLAGTIVAFYFGGRFQTKGHEFRQSITEATAAIPQVVENIEALRELQHDSPGSADTGPDADAVRELTELSGNAAVDAWRTGERDG